MADEQQHDLEVAKFSDINGFIDGRIEKILRQYDSVCDGDIVDELTSAFEKNLLMKTRKVVFKFAIGKVKSCIEDLEREAADGAVARDADDVVTPERTQPASAFLDQWELTGRRKKKKFASDILDLFKFYEGATTTFPKACLKKGGVLRPGLSTNITAIVESSVRIQQLDDELEGPEREKRALPQLDDSILDLFAAEGEGEEKEESVHETDSAQTEETQESADEQADTNNRQPNEERVESGAATEVDTTRTIGCQIGRSSATSIDCGTEACTPEDIKMSLRRINDEVPAMVRRCEYERYVKYVDNVFDEYRMKIQEIEAWKNAVDAKEGTVETGQMKRLFDLEMGQAGVIDEMGRMKLDMRDLDTRVIMNTRDIQVRKTAPRDKSKGNVLQQDKYESIWDIAEVEKTPEQFTVDDNGYAGVYVGRKENLPTCVQDMNSDPPSQPTLMQTRQGSKPQGIGRQGPVTRSTPLPAKNSRLPAMCPPASKNKQLPTTTPFPKPQRGIRESFQKATQRKGEEKGGKTLTPLVEETGTKEVSEPAKQSETGAAGDSWAEELSDNEIISCLGDTDDTFEDSVISDADTLVKDGAMMGVKVPDRDQGNRGRREQPRRADAAADTMAKSRAIMVEKGANQQRETRNFGRREPPRRAEENRRRMEENRNARPKAMKKGEAAVSRDRRVNDNKPKLNSYAAAAAKPMPKWETPKKRKRVKSAEKKRGSLTGANVEPQRDLFIQGIAFSRFSSYEDVEDMMYQYGEDRDFRFSFAKAIPVRGDKRQIGCKITVDEIDVETLLDEDFWPDKISVRFWHTGPRVPLEKNNGVYENDDEQSNN